MNFTPIFAKSSPQGFQQQLGDKHPDTMHCKMLLAETKLHLGNRKDAYEEFEGLFLGRAVFVWGAIVLRY